MDYSRWGQQRLVDTARERRAFLAGQYLCLGFLLAVLCQLTQGQELTWEYSVQVRAQIQTQPPAILFSWPQDQATLPDYYTVCRKTPGASQWDPPLVLPGTCTNFLETNLTVGVPAEYQFFKSTSNHVGYGYICAGIQLPLIENRGKILLLVDQSFATSLADELSQLSQDLVGDGWTVLRHDVAREAGVPAVKALIRADYEADPGGVQGLFLLGHIPVPYSGEMAPDGHPTEHSGAWPADTFYGDMDGVWTDTTVSNKTSAVSRNFNVPGDGKFDQSEIPGSVALQIGRVDFANMPGLDTNGVATFPSEGELLRRYLNKDHNYRHKKFAVPTRGLVFNETGDRNGEAFATDAWRSYAPLLGSPTRLLIPNEFLPLLRTNGYQWAYATAAATPTAMWHLGGGAWLPTMGTSIDFVRSDIQTVFTMLLGSWIGDWDSRDNLMRAVLATPSYGLACVYAGRPHWFFHPMALGETLGYCARLTQNNHATGLYRNQSNSYAGFVHIALLGDPTLRLQPVAPPANLQATFVLNGTQLSWSPSPENGVRYHIYRSNDPAGPFVRLTPSPLLATRFLDTAHPAETSTYMVRAIKLQTSPSGSYFNASQGVFATLCPQPVVRLMASGTNLMLTWPSVPGRVYRVLWCDSLATTNWAPVGGDLLATDSMLSCSNALSDTADLRAGFGTNANNLPGQRFYRVLLLP